MKDFNKKRTKYYKIRRKLNSKYLKILGLKGKLAKLDNAKEKMKRYHAKKGRTTKAFNEEYDKIKSKFEEGAKDLKKLNIKKQNALSKLLAKEYVDPVKNLSLLSSDYPLLLLPVRMETRFKKFDDQGHTTYEIWVRIFPDDCSVDTYEKDPSEDELNLTRLYWQSYWSAGNSENENLKVVIDQKRRASWKLLVEDFQPGRAHYLQSVYKPVNREDLPLRASADEIILIIAVEKRLSDNEERAIKTFWQEYVLANKNVDKIDKAKKKLYDAVSKKRGKQLISTYRPFNLSDALMLMNPKNVSAHIIHFRSLDKKRVRSSTWSEPARVTTFPERFVLLGYQKNRAGKLVQILGDEDSNGEKIGKFGNIIPDPLIIGPSPSEDKSTILIQKMIDTCRDLNDNALRDKLSQYYLSLRDEERLSLSEPEFIRQQLTALNTNFDEAIQAIFEKFREDVKANLYVEYIGNSAETAWVYDFEKAEEKGMAIRAELTRKQYDHGFDRLMVVGIKLLADHNHAKSELEELIKHHHYGTNGMSIIPQGTATNNTETQGSGFSEMEDSEDSFDQYFGVENIEDPDEFYLKKDGKWMAELLGINPSKSSLNRVKNYYITDQRESKAMNRALWAGTLGFWMESMMTPIFNDESIEVVRSFYTKFVSGRGNLPAIRIGDQPYGILTVSNLSDLKWLGEDSQYELEELTGEEMNIIKKLYTVLKQIRKDWQLLIDKIPFIGKDGDDFENLIKSLGHHAGSVEFDQRYAESLAHLYNHLNISLVPQIWGSIMAGVYRNRGIELLESLGYDEITQRPGSLALEDPSKLPPILEKFFFTSTNRLNGPLIDDRPLSEVSPIREYTNPIGPNREIKNYIGWLNYYAKNDPEVIKKQQEFSDGIPGALLYQMLRHSVEMEFSTTGFSLLKINNILTEAQIRLAKIGPNFIGIDENSDSRSRYDYLSMNVSGLAGKNVTLAHHLAGQLRNGNPEVEIPYLQSTVEALKILEDVPTARLERVFTEHLDCCNYRLDAWLLGLVNAQLYSMRSQRNKSEGIYLGAYGLVENLKPDKEDLDRKFLDGDLEDIFKSKKQAIYTDSSNAGFIHTPSINQAVTTAILRNAYISNDPTYSDDATTNSSQLYNINISSERVRMALSMIEGIQQGQSLAALLGYQFERRLHDRFEEAEMDKFIRELRVVFPLENQMTETAIDENDHESIAQIEAHNVINGLQLIKHIKNSGQSTYPFGKYLEEDANETEQRILDEEVDRLLNINDALADLAIAEGVHQIVQSNYERAAGHNQAYSDGGYPQIPEIIRTPRTGAVLTNRFAIHLKDGIQPDPNSNPKGELEPSLNKMLKDLLPNLDDIQCRVSFSDPGYGDGRLSIHDPITISLQELGINPIDLIYLSDYQEVEGLSSLDDMVFNFLRTQHELRPDVNTLIDYNGKDDERFSLYEVLPLLRDLRMLTINSRPLTPLDLTLAFESNSQLNDSITVNDEKLFEIVEKFKTLFLKQKDNPDEGIKLLEVDLMNSLQDTMEENLNIKDQIVNSIDEMIDKYIEAISNFNLFDNQHFRVGFIYHRKKAIYSGIYEIILELKLRWDEKLVQFAEFIQNVDPNNSPEENIDYLRKTELLISSALTPLSSLPAGGNIVDEYMQVVLEKRVKFEKKLGEIENWMDEKYLSIKALMDAVIILKDGKISENIDPLSIFDNYDLKLEHHYRLIIILAEDLTNKVNEFNAIIKKKTLKINAEDTRYKDEIDPIAKTEIADKIAVLLFGDDFKLIPRFELGAEAIFELNNSLSNTENLLRHQTDDLNVDRPIDNWLYGTARVRQKVGVWENIVMLTEGFNENNLDFTPLQIPYVDGDYWMGLSMPKDYALTSDKLLYNAHLQNFIPNQDYFNEGEFISGLFIDQWTEVIPNKNETTGLTFQYDQPKAESPQSMLLITPSKNTEHWEWNEVLDSIHQTLELLKLRAIEPDSFTKSENQPDHEFLNKSAYRQFLPAIISSTTAYPFSTIGTNFSFNNVFN